jgi:hypothetical protein
LPDALREGSAGKGRAVLKNFPASKTGFLAQFQEVDARLAVEGAKRNRKRERTH